MPIATRLTNTGTLLVNGTFDENTSITPSKFRTTSTAVYAGTLDEVDNMIILNGLLLYVNGSSGIYSGTGTQWTDLSTYNNNATLTNSPTYSSSTGGGSFAFNGTNQLAAVSTALLNTTYTGKTVFVVGRMNASAWTPGAAQYRAMYGTASGSRNFNFYVYHDAANLFYFHYSTPGSAILTNSVALTTGTWFVAAVTQDSTTTTVYLNGTAIYTVAGQTLNQYSSSGQEAVAAADNYWYGDIAVCALYSRALSAAEVLNNYNAFAARVGLSTSPISKRESSTGTLIVNTQFDEFTGAPVVDTSLQLWLDSGQTASYSGSGTTWTDLSGQSNTGTLTNSPTFSSTVGGGTFLFNGTNQTATTVSLNLQQNFTLEAWVNQSVLNGFAIFGQGTTVANQGLHIWYISNTSIRFGMFANDTDFTVSTSTGTWYHMIFTYNNSSPYTKGFYLNAVAQSGTTQQTQSAYAGSGTFRLGATYSTAGNYGNGYFEGVKMYNRILTADEVTTNFNALRGRYGI